eukprot:CAMPEP_0118850878 /NCGR_PEP_ID=MMETSP1163-20130328/536_1 /TAXON_ID=124430 /ORGANISM="Phaeomonas parva, Strain CCMP2877" /LENGTH=36 /DNA_ID= /DNA_START= /DNA_END= /DNA_ORIENTATION=
MSAYEDGGAASGAKASDAGAKVVERVGVPRLDAGAA